MYLWTIDFFIQSRSHTIFLSLAQITLGLRPVSPDSSTNRSNKINFSIIFLLFFYYFSIIFLLFFYYFSIIFLLFFYYFSIITLVKLEVSLIGVMSLPNKLDMMTNGYVEFVRKSAIANIWNSSAAIVCRCDRL